MSEPTRDRIVAAAAALLEAGGREAVSTRAVAAAAGVQAPTIYRQFGDKQGLLEAVVEHGYAAYVGGKLTRSASSDPLADLRRGWDLHQEFALAHPALYVLMTEPRPGEPSATVAAGMEHLRGLLDRLAAAGLLAVPVPRALEVFRAAGHGVALHQLDRAPAERDPEVPGLAYDAVVAAMTTRAPVVSEPGPAAAAVALRASLPGLDTLSAGERALLGELLDRIASG